MEALLIIGYGAECAAGLVLTNFPGPLCHFGKIGLKWMGFDMIDLI